MTIQYEGISRHDHLMESECSLLLVFVQCIILCMCLKNFLTLPIYVFNNSIVPLLSGWRCGEKIY